MSNFELDLAEKLKSNNVTDVHDTLLKIQKSYVRDHYKMKKLQKFSVIQEIIPLLEHPKFCNLSLSIIADGCLEVSFVSDVIKYNGIKALMRIMNSSVNDDVQNRACRALGNIAKFDIGFKAVHLMKPVSNIVKFLAETSDVRCQQTAVRTLMILGKSSKTRELISHENGIVHIAKLLHSSNLAVLICSIKALANLTQSCSLLCARQLLELHLLKILVDLHAHSEKSVRSNALISLKNLSSLEEIRSSLVKVGAVNLFTEVLSGCESHESARLAALALCNCLDHLHMWSHNGTDRAVGLKALLLVLQNIKFQDIHFHIIVSLFPLSFESKVTDILLNLDLIEILINILKVFIEKHKCKATLIPGKIMGSDSYKGLTDVKVVKASSSLSSYYDVDHTLSKKTEIDSKTKEVRDENNFTSSECTSITLQPVEKNSTSLSSLKTFNNWDRSLYSFSSITSDYSSSYSPNRMCSPTQICSASPEQYYELDLGSPSVGHESSSVCSPTSVPDEYIVSYPVCWSPVVSSQSDPESDSPESYSIPESCDSQEETSRPVPSLECNLVDINFENKIISPAVTSEITLHSHEQASITLKNNEPKLCDDAEIPRKRLKIDEKDRDTESTFQTSVELQKTANKDVHLEDQVQFPSLKNLKENIEGQTIDYHIIHFLLQLSFHLEKKINSQIADKNCFTTLIDYLCLIHNPCSKAETVLFNLIKNRYCFEKVIISGFVSEMEEKMTMNYSCGYHSDAKVIYFNLIDAGRQEAESDYGIGTLSHILVTSEKRGQFYAICALSKLVTDKSALHKILFQANGLPLLFTFLSDVTTRRKVIISLCELYQSLTKDQKVGKCCIEGTCNLKSTSKCSYKEAFLNVTFSVNNGAQILANREKICENSEYFQALLSGHFLETNATLISLPGISAENLSTIFHFLHGCGSGRCCPYIKRIPFSVLLELLSDCDRFLLTNIKVFVEDRLCHRLFVPTMPKIYKQSKIHNSPALTRKTLEFALSTDTMKRDSLWYCFEELIKFESNFNFFDDIKNLFRNILGV